MAIQFAPTAPKPVVKETLIVAKKRRKPGGGRPKLAKPKAVLNIRVDPDVLERWKTSGDGWQTRLQEIMRANAP